MRFSASLERESPYQLLLPGLSTMTRGGHTYLLRGDLTSADVQSSYLCYVNGCSKELRLDEVPGPEDAGYHPLCRSEM